MENPSVRKQVKRKGKIIKFVTSDDLASALKGEDVFCFDSEVDRKEHNIHVNEKGERQLIWINQDAEAVFITLEHPMLWVLTFDKNGDVLDHAQYEDTEGGRYNMDLWLSFLKYVDAKYQAWYVTKDGMTRIED